MRPSLRASDNALVRLLVRLIGGVSCGLLVLSCAYGPPAASVKQPPPRVIVIGLEHLALRTSAWVELHAWLGAAARSPRDTEDPIIEESARGYALALAGDDRDELMGRTTSVLETCIDERCARAAVTGTPFGGAYVAALPSFLQRHWPEFEAKARSTIEIARASMGAEHEPLLTKIAADLAIEWPPAPPVVDVVTESTQGRESPIRGLLAARGGCFSKHHGEPDRVHDARIMDCVLTYTMLGMKERSPIGRAATTDSRSWAALVVNAVTTNLTAWEPRHESVLRSSAKKVMPSQMEWLAREWPSRLRGEPAPAFATRYAAAAAHPDPPTLLLDAPTDATTDGEP